MESEKELNQLKLENQHQSYRDLIETIISAVTEYTGDSPQTDDMTLMIIKRILSI